MLRCVGKFGGLFFGFCVNEDWFFKFLGKVLFIC